MPFAWEPMARYCLTQHGLGVCGWGAAETGQGQSLSPVERLLPSSQQSAIREPSVNREPGGGSGGGGVLRVSVDLCCPCPRGDGPG